MYLWKWLILTMVIKIYSSFNFHHLPHVKRAWLQNYSRILGYIGNARLGVRRVMLLKKQRYMLKTLYVKWSPKVRSACWNWLLLLYPLKALLKPMLSFAVGCFNPNQDLEELHTVMLYLLGLILIARQFLSFWVFFFMYFGLFLLHSIPFYF